MLSPLYHSCTPVIKLSKVVKTTMFELDPPNQKNRWLSLPTPHFRNLKRWCLFCIATTLSSGKKRQGDSNFTFLVYLAMLTVAVTLVSPSLGKSRPRHCLSSTAWGAKSSHQKTFRKIKFLRSYFIVFTQLPREVDGRAKSIFWMKIEFEDLRESRS